MGFPTESELLQFWDSNSLAMYKDEYNYYTVEEFKDAIVRNGLPWAKGTFRTPDNSFCVIGQGFAHLGVFRDLENVSSEWHDYHWASNARLLDELRYITAYNDNYATSLEDAIESAVKALNSLPQNAYILAVHK